MNKSSIDFLDLPNEILIIILKKLDNVDVLYSLCGINKERIHTLINSSVFTSILSFVGLSSTTDVKLNRFCSHILPENHQCVKKLILDKMSMERILLASDYPNLNSLELFDSGKEIFFRYMIDNSIFEEIFKHQITDLILHFNDEYFNSNSTIIYIQQVYPRILTLFKNLKHLTFDTSSIHDYPPLTFHNLPPTIYFSSTLTTLCISVVTFRESLLILDGRLKQLTTFKVQIFYIDLASKTPNIDKLKHLKCFSLTSYEGTSKYNELIVPLLRRMTHLEKLTLYLSINAQNDSIDETSLFVDGTHLQNKILIFMPHLHTFIFYINTRTYIHDSDHRKSTDYIQQTFKNIKYGPTACMIRSYKLHISIKYQAICYVYSLPFRFTRLSRITNQLPNIGFDTVTHLYISDRVSMEHEFFMRISQAFPLLKYFSLKNGCSQSFCFELWRSDENPFNPIIEYSNLISLDIMNVDKDYIAQFLLETKTHLPRLTELQVNYGQLATVTRYFTRDTMRRNCSKVKRLIVEKYLSQDILQYFPSLLIESCVRLE